MKKTLIATLIIFALLFFALSVPNLESGGKRFVSPKTCKSTYQIRQAYCGEQNGELTFCEAEPDLCGDYPVSIKGNKDAEKEACLASADICLDSCMNWANSQTYILACQSLADKYLGGSIEGQDYPAP